jgi:hypothetical protein
MIALKAFGELVMRHKGASICVMGGGANLARDIDGLKADVWISTNAHGAKLRSVDYVVAMDNLHTVTKEQMEGLIRPHTDAPIIGPWHWCDYGVTNYPLAPRLIFSGVIAQWVACMLGAHPLIMAGFDCYGYGRDSTLPEGRRSLNQHKDIVPHLSCAVRVVSGPLTALWPAYDPAETFGAYTPPGLLAMTAADEHGVFVKVIKPIEIRGRQYPIGTTLHAPHAEVWRQIKHRSLMEVPAPKPAPIKRSAKWQQPNMST